MNDIRKVKRFYVYQIQQNEYDLVDNNITSIK